MKDKKIKTTKRNGKKLEIYFREDGLVSQTIYYDDLITTTEKFPTGIPVEQVNVDPE